MKAPPLEKYLAHYSEWPSLVCEGFPLNFRHSVVVPSYREPVAALRALWQSLAAQDCVLILVLNEPAGTDGKLGVGMDSNRACIDELQQRGHALWNDNSHQLQLFAIDQAHVLLVDCCSTEHRIDPKQGVGLARKIGTDLACRLIHAGYVSAPWIYNTDADVSLPKDYLRIAAVNAEPPTDKIAAYVLPFKHTRSGEACLDQAQVLYDWHMQYYCNALRWAGSPYAYHSLGSTQIIHAEHYAKVRGYPKRSAGEDFYLLNKLSKTGDVISLDAPLIAIQTRLSQRTPFGTGQAVESIITLQHPVQEYLFYHPSIFSALRNFLGQFETLASNGTLHADKATLEVLEQLEFDRALERGRQNSQDKKVLLKHLHDWFDAFRTLKFVHLMRDNHWPSINLHALIETLPTELQPQANSAIRLEL